MYAAKLKHQSEQNAFYLSTFPIQDVVRKYANGTTGHMKSVIINLLKEYYRYSNHGTWYGVNSSNGINGK